MIQTITSSQARQNLSTYLNKVYAKEVQFIIQRNGRPVAKLISIDATVPVAGKKVDKLAKSALFGLWKDKKESTIAIADRLRKEAWGR